MKHRSIKNVLALWKKRKKKKVFEELSSDGPKD
jgi:hypothetical protein